MDSRGLNSLQIQAGISGKERKAFKTQCYNGNVFVKETKESHPTRINYCTDIPEIEVDPEEDQGDNSEMAPRKQDQKIDSLLPKTHGSDL